MTIQKTTFAVAITAAFKKLGQIKDAHVITEEMIIDRTFDVIEHVCLDHIHFLQEELMNIDPDNWIVATECGSGVLALRTGHANVEQGHLEAAVKETGETWMRIHLDDVIDDDFEPMLLISKDPVLLQRVKELVDSLKEAHGISAIQIVYQNNPLFG